MIEPKQLRDLIIIPALERIDKYSDAAVNLLLGTCAQESAMGRFIHQLGSGPACGIFQMEPATHDDIWDNYLAYNEDLKKMAIDSTAYANSESLIHNLKYAAIMCRIHYLRVPEALPDKDDIVGMAEYWKEHYNTYQGAGSMDEFIDNYQKYVKKVAL